ncbi:ankyrin, partial [Piromyces finnis]
LLDAIREGHVDMVKYFIDQGIDVNHHLERNDTFLLNSIENGSITIINYLIESGADINFPGREENRILYTPLKFAILLRKVYIIKYLVHHSADINKIPPFNSGTPLYFALLSKNDDIIQFI